MLATAYDVLEVTSPDQAASLISDVVTKEGVERLLVGLPLNMDDTAGDAAHKTVAWAQSLSASIGRPVVFVDERLSSFAAEQQLVERKRGGERITRGDKKRRLDAIAAAALLQEFLDGRLPAIDASAL
jgi:putative holliday junction resolvase